MTTLQMRYFQYLAKNLHLGETAEHFMVSPPAISASIRRLEEELDTMLFGNVGRSLILTPEGKIFLTHVNEILSSLAVAEDEIKRSKDGAAQVLSIGVVSPILWQPLIKSFIQDNPDIKMSTTLLKTHQFQNPNIFRTKDFIFCDSGMFSDASFNSYILPMDNSPCLAVYKNHRFAGRKSLDLIEAKDERFIALSLGYSYRSYFDSLCHLAGFTPNIILECDFQFRAAMLAAEYGILVTTKAVADMDILGDVHYVNISNPHFVRIQALFANKLHAKSPAAKQFLEYVKSYYGITDENL